MIKQSYVQNKNNEIDKFGNAKYRSKVRFAKLYENSQLTRNENRRYTFTRLNGMKERLSVLIPQTSIQPSNMKVECVDFSIINGLS